MSLNYSRQLDRIELRLTRMEVLLNAVVKQTILDPQKIAEIEAELASATAELQATIDANQPTNP